MADLVTGNEPRTIRYETQSGGFSRHVLDLGFGAGLLLAFACLVLSAFYLNAFLTTTNDAVQKLVAEMPKDSNGLAILDAAINARLVIARLALQSCGVFVGMGFGFIGFALFLIGVRGEIDGTARFGDSQIAFTKLAPGVFVILCSSILIGVCVTRSTPYGSSTIITPNSETRSAGSSKPDSNYQPIPQSKTPLKD